jgi:hypothetical protein
MNGLNAIHFAVGFYGQGAIYLYVLEIYATNW